LVVDRVAGYGLRLEAIENLPNHFYEDALLGRHVLRRGAIRGSRSIVVGRHRLGYAHHTFCSWLVRTPATPPTGRRPAHPAVQLRRVTTTRESR
jgi:hypothetical protein